MSVRVAINGFGTIGKRVADAVALQNDMRVAGVTKTKPSTEALVAVAKGYPLYVAKKESLPAFEKAGIKVAGTLDDLLTKAEIVVDCTPEDTGAAMKPVYEKLKVKAIFQGGEEHALTGTSFNAAANYGEALGKSYVRVVSCNTTGLIRSLFPLTRELGVRRVNATMIRRATDPGDSKKGPINAIIPVLTVPSHHGPDVATVIKGLDIRTMAVAVPTTLMHVHAVTVELQKETSAGKVIGIWEKTPRIRFVEGGLGVTSSAQIMEHARDLGRARGDFPEVAIWREGVSVKGDSLYYFQAIHQESDVVPENVDCIRAMCELETDPMRSIEKTNRALGIA